MTVYYVLKNMGCITSNDVFDGVYEVLLDSSRCAPVGAAGHASQANRTIRWRGSVQKEGVNSSFWWSYR
jgi:hypothetical protein